MKANDSDSKPRIAASSYLNTAPLIWSFLHGSQSPLVELFTDTAPARCAEMLARQEVDAALVPVIEYEGIPEIAVVPDVCVGSKTAVRSVVLATRKNNLKKIARVALDESSRTSATLLKILFREFLGIELQWKTSPPDLKSMLKEADAALIIGDPAMNIPRDQLRVFDLATLWHEFTGFGFVFAMWMMRKQSVGRLGAISFSAARDEGLTHLDKIAANAKGVRLSHEEIKSYLIENVVFKIDSEMEKGLQLYLDLAAKWNLIPKATPLEFLS